MGKLLFIDSDDISGLSEALQNALEKRGVRFRADGSGEFDYPSTDEEEPDIDPYIGAMPHAHRKNNNDNDSWLFQESGGVRYNSGECGYTMPMSHCGMMSFCGASHYYGGCGGSGNRSASCGYGGCGGYRHYGSCGGGAHC